MKKRNAEFTFVITNHVATLSTNPTSNWSKELNLIEWNGRPAVYDIRDWSPDHKLMGKGVTLTTEEFTALAGVFKAGDVKTTKKAEPAKKADTKSKSTKTAKSTKTTKTAEPAKKVKESPKKRKSMTDDELLAELKRLFR